MYILIILGKFPVLVRLLLIILYSCYYCLYLYITVYYNCELLSSSKLGYSYCLNIRITKNIIMGVDGDCIVMECVKMKI